MLKDATDLLQKAVDYLISEDLSLYKAFFATFLGSILQFVYTPQRKTFKLLVAVLLSSLLLALFVVDPLMDYHSIQSNSPLRIVAYTVSALISSEVVSFVVIVLPPSLRLKVLKELGVKKGENK